MAAPVTSGKSLGNAFGFPFTPYSIQTDFMHELTTVLDDGKGGVFESPTGTVRDANMMQLLKPQQHTLTPGKNTKSHVCCTKLDTKSKFKL